MNAELEMLMGRLRAIQADIGVPGDGKKKKKKAGADEFADIKSRIVGRIRQISKLARDRDQLEDENGEPKEIIALNSRIHAELTEIVAEYEELQRLYQKEARKRKSKFTEEELELRRDIVDDIARQLREVKDVARRRPKGAAGGEEAMDDFAAETTFAISRDEFLTRDGAGGGRAAGAAGGGGLDGVDLEAGRARREEVEEALTDGHEAKLQEFKEREGRQDELLDRIGEGVLELKELALAMGDEVNKQGMILGEIENKVDKAQGHLDTVNSKLKRQLQEARSADKLCMDIVCCLLLVGIITVVYNMVRKHTA